MIRFHRVQDCSKKITEKTNKYLFRCTISKAAKFNFNNLDTESLLDLLESFLFNLQMIVSRLYHECIINVSYYILNTTDSITKTATKDNNNWEIVLSKNLLSMDDKRIRTVSPAYHVTLVG